MTITCIASTTREASQQEATTAATFESRFSVPSSIIFGYREPSSQYRLFKFSSQNRPAAAERSPVNASGMGEKKFARSHAPCAACTVIDLQDRTPTHPAPRVRQSGAWGGKCVCMRISSPWGRKRAVEGLTLSANCSLLHVLITACIFKSVG